MSTATSSVTLSFLVSANLALGVPAPELIARLSPLWEKLAHVVRAATQSTAPGGVEGGVPFPALGRSPPGIRMSPLRR